MVRINPALSFGQYFGVFMYISVVFEKILTLRLLKFLSHDTRFCAVGVRICLLCLWPKYLSAVESSLITMLEPYLKSGLGIFWDMVKNRVCLHYGKCYHHPSSLVYRIIKSKSHKKCPIYHYSLAVTIVTTYNFADSTFTFKNQSMRYI